MLTPKRTKYRKVQKGILKGKAQRGTQVTDGEYGIQALEPAWITANQIESVRVTISRYTKKVGKSWIKIFPDKPITKHPAKAIHKLPIRCKIVKREDQEGGVQ